MIRNGEWTKRLSASPKSRMIVFTVLVEIASIGASALLIPAVKYGLLDSSGGGAIFTAYLTWTVPVSIWIGVRGSDRELDSSGFGFLRPALIVGGLTFLGIFVTGIVFDLANCSRGPGDGAQETVAGVECGSFPGFTAYLGLLVALGISGSILVGSLVAGVVSGLIRNKFD